MTRDERARTTVRVEPKQGSTVARRWITGVAAGAAVVGVVVVVQLATGGGATEPVNVGAQPVAVGSDTVSAGDPSSAPGESAPAESAAAGGLAAAVELFGADGDEAPDVVRETAVDATAAWPVSGCAAAAAPEAGRVDFVSGVESGPEYSRDLAIGWYVDEAAATAAYDALVARIATCAADAGAVLTTGAADLGTRGSFATAAVPLDVGDADADAVNAALYASASVGAVVVLAVDHAVFYGGSETAADSPAGSSAQADRLLAEACRTAPDRC